jgi:hypothetical protein
VTEFWAGYLVGGASMSVSVLCAYLTARWVARWRRY